MDKENIDPAKKKHVFKFKPLSSQFKGVESKKLVVREEKPVDKVESTSTVKHSCALPRYMCDSDSTDDENDESRRVRKKLEAERLLKNPNFNAFDPKFHCIRYTTSGKPYRKSSKPYWAWAANTYGYLRYNKPAQKKVKIANNGLVNGDSGSGSDEDELGLHTIAFPMTVRAMKEDIAKEMAKEGVFQKSVNDVFRERYYIELPYCRWCDTRPCACYV